MYLMLTQPMPYMHQPPMPYMQQPPMAYMPQPPYQVPVYQLEMATPGGFCPEVPAGVFSGMLAGAGFDVDLTRVFGLDGGSQGGEGSGSHSGSDSVE
ncbi:hypothetical protein DVH24_034329 [Malus domestica]|uniref:Pinin-like n=1 Tax=Malus domestica TaxID=3750 RepID=A0A498IVP1_MALDO|nr:hypothetical protein DVH24_034329 [Malus domestica]